MWETIKYTTYFLLLTYYFLIAILQSLPFKRKTIILIKNETTTTKKERASKQNIYIYLNPLQLKKVLHKHTVITLPESLQVFENRTQVLKFFLLFLMEVLYIFRTNEVLVNE